MGLRDKARESAIKPSAEAPEDEKPEERAPEAASAEPSSSGVGGNLEPGVTYLVEEEKPELSYSLFMTASRNGMRGMVISRTYPKNLRKAMNLGDVPVYWLTNAMSDEAVGPKDLERLTLSIRRFLEEGGGQLVLIDSLEYIITNNKFVSVLRLLQTLRDLIAIHKAVCIVGLKSSTLEPSKLASIQRELEVYTGDKPAPTPPPKETESPAVAELKQDEIIIEAERVEQEKKKLAAEAARVKAEAQKLTADRAELEKERQEVRQTLVRVRQTRKELENFRIKLTSEEAELTSKVRAKLTKEMQSL
ncbi:MAG: hypothetical protein A3K75_03985, partial [Euryarchaeota archaeon RBG_13_61_15]